MIDWFVHLVQTHPYQSVAALVGYLVLRVWQEERAFVNKYAPRTKARRKKGPKFTRPVISLHGENEVSGRAMKWKS